MQRERSLLWPWLFHLAAAVSLLLCAAAVGLCVRSYWRWDALHWNSEFRSDFSQYCYKLEARAGVVLAKRGVSRFDSGARAWWVRPGWYHQSEPAGMPTFHEVLRRRGREFIGFGYFYDPEDVTFRRSDRPSTSEVAVAIPHWALVLCLGAAPAAWTLRHRRQLLRQTRGECRRCGYDLRATPDRCPECGAVPKLA